MIGVVLGGLWGAVKARRLGGKGMDLLHYAAIFALIGALLGLFATIILHRSMA
jgi:hypothetical protein